MKNQFRFNQSHREDEQKPKEWTSDSNLNNLGDRERGWIEYKRMNKGYRSKQSHGEREMMNRFQKNEQVIHI
jgi:hypothetical protein